MDALPKCEKKIVLVCLTKENGEIAYTRRCEKEKKALNRERNYCPPVCKKGFDVPETLAGRAGNRGNIGTTGGDMHLCNPASGINLLRSQREWLADEMEKK